MKRDGKFYGTQIMIIAICVMMVTAVMPAMADDWTEFQKDEVNVGRTGDSAPITNASGSAESWVHQTVSGNFYGIDSVPIVVGDYVYVLTSNSSNAYLYKYQKDGGDSNWANNRGTVGSGNFQNSCPAYGDGKIFVINTGYGSTPQLYAINADSGSTSQASTGWSTNPVSVGTSDYQVSCPITYHEAGSNKRIFFGSVRMSNEDPVNLSDDGTYYCFDASNGNKLWSRNTSSGGGYYWAGAAVIGDYLVYGDDKSHLVSVEWNNVTGSVPWTADEINVSAEYGIDAKEIRSSITWNNTGDPSDDYGHIYFTSKGGYCYALGFDKGTGTFNTADKWHQTIGYSTSTPAVYKGKVYVGHNAGFSNGKLYCLNENNGLEVWNAPIGPVQSSPAISTYYDDGDGEIYIYVTTNSATGGLYCIDKDGNEVWHNNSIGTQSSHRYCLAGAAISDDWVFYGNDGGYLHGLKKSFAPSNLDINTSVALNGDVNISWDGTATSYDIYIADTYPNFGKTPAVTVSTKYWIDTDASEHPKERYYKVAYNISGVGQRPGDETVGYYNATAKFGPEPAYTVISVPHVIETTDINDVLKYNHAPGQRLEGGLAFNADYVTVQNQTTGYWETSRLSSSGTWSSAVDLPSDIGFRVYIKPGHTVPTNVVFRMLMRDSLGDLMVN